MKIFLDFIFLFGAEAKKLLAAFGVEKGKLIFVLLNDSAAVSCLKRS